MNDYPIILAHGIAPFDVVTKKWIKEGKLVGIDLSAGLDEILYFKGMKNFLNGKGFDVEYSSVEFAGSVEERAEDLRKEVERILGQKQKPKAHIIAHSMGGLDSRLMIFNNENKIADKIASLTTIGTPHWGSSFATWAIEHHADEALKALGEFINLDGVKDLTVQKWKEFNERLEKSEAHNNIHYQTYSSVEEKELIFSLLQLSWKIIFEREGANDGLVSRASQRWKDKLVGDGITKPIPQKDFPISADHLNEIGWWDWNQLKMKHTFIPTIFYAWWYEKKIKDVYLEIAEGLRQLSV
jgi:triacylglycerol lipase